MGTQSQAAGQKVSAQDRDPTWLLALKAAACISVVAVCVPILFIALTVVYHSARMIMYGHI